MAPKFRVHAFRLAKLGKSGELSRLLQKISKTPLANRTRTVYGVNFRIENVSAPKGKRDYWLFDFGRFRDDHGPGKASPNAETSGFTFEEDESFSEETAGLYIPKTRHIILQYNHHGTRAGSVEQYLSSFDDNNDYLFELQPTLDPDTDKRYENRKSTKSITFSVDPRQVTANDRKGGASLSQLLGYADKSGGDTVRITVSTRSRKIGLASNVVDKTIAKLRSINENTPGTVKDLQARIAEGVDEKSVTLDLLEHKLTHVFEDVPVDKDLRMSRKNRYNALGRARNSWKNKLK